MTTERNKFVALLEEKAVAAFAARTGTTPKRPRCYREAQYDERGNLLPSGDLDLEATATAQAAMRHDEAMAQVEPYLAATMAWPNGKESLIESRIGNATAEAWASLSLFQRFKESGFDFMRGPAIVITETGAS